MPSIEFKQRHIMKIVLLFLNAVYGTLHFKHNGTKWTQWNGMNFCLK